MNTFSFTTNQKVIFEVNASAKVTELLEEKKVLRVLIVSGRPLYEVGLLNGLIQSLEEKEIAYELVLDVEPNPSIGTVDKAVDMFKRIGADCIIAVGGGSAMDTAKLVAVLGKYGGRCEDYSNYFPGFKPVPGPTVPLIAIPTTAGTGSESTCTAVVTDPSKGFKFAVTSRYMFPEYAVLDPLMITGIPQGLAASTGMDALVHAMETYLSQKATPYTEAFAEKAIRLIGKNIRPFVANRKNIEAASAMMIASNFAAQAFTEAWLGDVHAIAHPLGGFCNVVHGTACSIMLPVVLEFNALADTGKYQRMYELLTDKKTDNFEPMMLVEYVKKLSVELGIPQHLSEVGVPENLISTIAQDAMKSGNIYNNPRQATVKDIENMLKKAF